MLQGLVLALQFRTGCDFHTNVFGRVAEGVHNVLRMGTDPGYQAVDVGERVLARCAEMRPLPRYQSSVSSMVVRA